MGPSGCDCCGVTEEVAMPPLFRCAGVSWHVAATLASLIMVWGCSPRVERASNPPAPSVDATGVWDGVSVNDCSYMQIDPSRCRAKVEIMLTMLQEGAAISGFYKCATGAL
jgi:hypothetical protein